MLSEKMEQALNEQIQYEFYSANLYLSMSAYFKSVDLDGFAQSGPSRGFGIKHKRFITMYVPSGSDRPFQSIPGLAGERDRAGGGLRTAGGASYSGR